MSERGYMGEPRTEDLVIQALDQLKREYTDNGYTNRDPSIQELIERAECLKNPYPC